MVKGRPQYEYFMDPLVHEHKSIETIYAEMDQITFEVFPGDPDFERVSVYVVLPPLAFEGRFVKGILYTQGADYVASIVPKLRERFHVIANPMWSNYPWAKEADAYFVSYNNPQRDTWFKTQNPDRSKIILIPQQDRDNTNEYKYAPVLDQRRTRDLFCISRLDPCKNIPLLAESLVTYHRKYKRPINFTLVIGRPFDHFTERDKSILNQFKEITQPIQEHIKIYDHLHHSRDIPQFYAQSRITLLTSLLEGKNRALVESALANTPVITFEAHNQYTRGSDDIFPKGAGLYAPFGAEGLADTIETLLVNHGDFSPRKAYLARGSGRPYFFDAVLNAFPYYAEHVPGFKDGPPHQNLWLNMAIHHNYQLSLNDFLYEKAPDLTHRRGSQQISAMLDQYWYP